MHTQKSYRKRPRSSLKIILKKLSYKLTWRLTHISLVTIFYRWGLRRSIGVRMGPQSIHILESYRNRPRPSLKIILKRLSCKLTWRLTHSSLVTLFYGWGLRGSISVRMGPKSIYIQKILKKYTQAIFKDSL